MAWLLTLSIVDVNISDDFGVFFTPRVCKWFFKCISIEQTIRKHYITVEVAATFIVSLSDFPPDIYVPSSGCSDFVAPQGDMSLLDIFKWF